MNAIFSLPISLFRIPEFLLVISAFLNFTIGVVIFTKLGKRLYEVLYSLLSVVVAVWSISILYFRLSPLYEVVVGAGKVAYVSALLTTFLLLWFSILFLREKSLPIFLGTVFVTLNSLFLAIFIYLVVFTDLILKSFIVSGPVRGIIFGVNYIFYSLFLSFQILASIVILVLKLKKVGNSENGREKQIQILYILVGVSLTSFISTFTNMILFGFGIYEYNWAGPSSTLIMIIALTYAITRHHLFDLKIVATEIFVLGLLIVQGINVLYPYAYNRRTVDIITFLASSLFGALLVRGVLQEVETRQRLELLNRAKTEFIAMTSHQLRTPLTIIKGYISMILEGSYGKVSPKILEPLQNIYNSNERLIRLVNDLLNISRIETGKIHLQIEKVDIKEIIDDVVNELEKNAKDKGLELRVRYLDDKDLIIKGDRLKLREAISVVVDNAIKYTERGWIEIRVHRKEKGVEIQVQDTGVGLTEDEKRRIFESFSRGRAGLNLFVEGAGLGLYLAKKYIELHSGNIWAESEGKNKGSTFYIFLPFRNNLANRVKK